MGVIIINLIYKLVYIFLVAFCFLNAGSNASIVQDALDKVMDIL